MIVGAFNLKSAYLCGASDYLCGASAYLCGASDYLRGASAYLCGASAYLFGGSAYLCGTSANPCSASAYLQLQMSLSIYWKSLDKKPLFHVKNNFKNLLRNVHTNIF